MSSPDLGDVLARRCVAVAKPRSATDRAWQLVGLGTALGRIGESKLALTFLDAAVALEPDQRAKAAAYECAVQLHWDAGDVETARKVNESRPAV
jgi:hypothetical protein